MNNRHVLTNHNGDEKDIEIFVAKCRFKPLTL